MPTDVDVEDVLHLVTQNARYRMVNPAFIRRIARQEIDRRASLKEVVKSTRNKIHQVAGAYLEGGMDFPAWLASLGGVPGGIGDPALREVCRQLMVHHSSTRERLPILDQFYEEILGDLAPIHSLLDLACGLNPLALPWMPVAQDLKYFAYDLFSDLANFLNHYFNQVEVDGHAGVCDLTQEIPAEQVQVALVLKTIPCLEQVDKTLGMRLLQSIQAESIIVSFPAQSLGGRKKGMVENYTAHFEQLLAGFPWQWSRHLFPGELVYRIRR